MLIINEADSACCLCSEPNIMTWVFISFKINSLNEESAPSLWERAAGTKMGLAGQKYKRNRKSLIDVIQLYVGHIF